MKVYVAAPLKKKAGARYAAERLRNAGIEVVSRWHETTDTEDPEGYSDRRFILESNLADLDGADAVLVVSPEGGRTTYFEAGYAIGRGTPVLWVYSGAATSIADAHFMCSTPKSIEAAIEELKGAS